MEKIIKVIMYGEQSINDKEKIMKLIDVNSTRQVSYYLSALQFFHILTYNKEFTNKAKNIFSDKAKIEEYIYEFLMENDLFSKFYYIFLSSKKVDIEIIKKGLKSKKQQLSESTINRRSSTIKAWLEWMYSYKSDN